MSDSNKPSGPAKRRGVLKKIAIGGGLVSMPMLPSKWVEPAVNSVVLPAHAQTSPGGGNGGTTTSSPGGSSSSSFSSSSFSSSSFSSSSVSSSSVSSSSA